MLISLVIPVYNEEENLGPLYEEIKEVIHPLAFDFEIIFVDDGSTDSTYKRLFELSKKDPRITIIKFRSNFGQSAALKAGFDRSKGKYIITMDADLQNDPKDIPALLNEMESEDYDVISGWRYNRHDPFSKKLVSKFANFLRNKFTNEKIHDSGCTLKIYKQECTQDLDLYGELHRYIPALLAWKGYKVGELKTNHRERLHGHSKYNWRRLIKGFLDLLVITFWQRYSVRPIHIFGSIGIVLGFLGGIVALYLGILRLFFGGGLSDRPLFTASIMLLVIGVQFLTMGILADIMVKVYYGQNGRRNYLVERIIE